MGKKRGKNFKKVVQGEWTLGHTDQELRENVFVGDIPLKDLKEEELAAIWEGKIGTHYFRQAVKREVVYRVSEYFKVGYEKVEKLGTPNTIAGALPVSKPKDEIDRILEKAQCLKQS